MCEMKDMLKQQQEQLNQLTQTIALIQRLLNIVIQGSMGLQYVDAISDLAILLGNVMVCVLPLGLSSPRKLPGPQLGSQNLPQLRQTNTHQTSEPQFGWGLYWLKCCER